MAVSGIEPAEFLKVTARGLRVPFRDFQKDPAAPNRPRTSPKPLQRFEIGVRVLGWRVGPGLVGPGVPGHVCLAPVLLGWHEPRWGEIGLFSAALGTWPQARQAA